MKVKKLIEELKKYSEDMEVYFSCDEEGNIISPMADIISVPKAEDATGRIVKNCIIVYPYG